MGFTQTGFKLPDKLIRSRELLELGLRVGCVWVIGGEREFYCMNKIYGIAWLSGWFISGTILLAVCVWVCLFSGLLEGALTTGTVS
jgi:hypothetical protein